MRVVPDVLVNDAGIVRFGPLLDQSLADMKTVVNVNLIGTYVTARAVARQMIARGSGIIINMKTIMEYIRRLVRARYAATQTAIATLTLMALQWGDEVFE